MSELRSLFYANLPIDGRRLENAAYHELKEFRKFLQIARDYQRNETLLRVLWKTDGPLGRDKTQWVEIIACPDRKNESEATFREFLSSETEFVFESAPPAESAERRERRSYFNVDHQIKILKR